MTNEQMATLIQSDRETFKELLPILWKKVNRLLFKLARDFYNKHTASCTQRGVELSDIEGGCYAVFLAALDAYKPDKFTLFMSYFDYPFKNMTAELLNIRTERGRQEPLNNCDSLDREITQDDGSKTTLLDLTADRQSDFENDVIEGLNREQEALAVREAVAALPEQMCRVVELYYFEGRTLREISELLGVSASRIQQINHNALRELRKNRQLRTIYYENQQHQAECCLSRFRYSPQYFDIVEQLRERELSYGKTQAELYKAEQKYIRNNTITVPNLKAMALLSVHP